jgi:hypothetical protein
MLSALERHASQHLSETERLFTEKALSIARDR